MVVLIATQRGLTKKKEAAVSEHKNTQLVQQAYADFKSEDIPAVLKLLSDDVEWIFPKIEGVPYSGKHQGREEVGQFFTTLGDSQEVLEFEPRKFVAQSDKVVALGHYAWRVKATGKEFASDFAHAFTVHEERIARFQEYADTDAAADAYRRG